MIPGDGGDLPDLARTRAETLARSVLPAGAAVWTAAEVMHLTGQPGTLASALAGAALTAVSWGVSLKHDGLGWLPWWAGAGAVLLGTADKLGPLDWWPAPVLTGMWAVATLIARHKAHGHEAVVNAREQREQRARWLMRRNDWGLGGSHLIGFERTDIGELYTVNVKGTGKKRSQILASNLAEHIAQAEDLDENRVELIKYGPAGRIRISIRRRDPWEHPFLHPLAYPESKIEIPAARSILNEAMVGQTPGAGDPLTVPLVTEDGANRVSVTGISGAGKGIFIDNLMEHVTACPDALLVHLNLSIKGHEDEECWGPACWLTAYGPNQKARAAAVLKVIAAVIEWRTKNFKRAQYTPSPEHPAIIIVNDESDSSLGFLREDISTIVTKGRSAGVGWVRVGQRNTREYADPQARSQDNVMCTGMVRSANEDRHAGTGTGPSMATYGEGRPGVWKIERLGGGQQTGRTWMLHPKAAGHAAECERIAKERAYDQPELSGDCLEYLGAPYQVLRATEVFERYDRSLHPEAYEDDALEAGETPAAEIPASAAPAPQQEPAAAPSAARTAVADREPLDLEELFRMDDPAAARLEQIHEKNAATRRLLEQHAVPPAGLVSPESVADRTAERWRQLGEATEIPDAVRPGLLGMLADGTTIAAVAARFGVSRWEARKWLARLGFEGLADVEGEGRARQWRLTPPPDAGDSR